MMALWGIDLQRGAEDFCHTTVKLDERMALGTSTYNVLKYKNKVKLS